MRFENQRWPKLLMAQKCRTNPIDRFTAERPWDTDVDFGRTNPIEDRSVGFPPALSPKIKEIPPVVCAPYSRCSLLPVVGRANAVEGSQRRMSSFYRTNPIRSADSTEANGPILFRPRRATPVTGRKNTVPGNKARDGRVSPVRRNPASAGALGSFGRI
jgi:hypothetical protein